MSPFLTVLRVLTTTTATLVMVAPVPDFWRIQKTQSIGEVSILPVVMLFCNCYMWVLYAYRVGNIFPLFAVTLFGMITSTVFIGIYYPWTTERLYVFKHCGVAAVLLFIGTVYYVFGINGVINQSDAAVEKTLGFICVAFNMALYASPLETMKKVIQTKSASSLPIAISVVFLVNAALWVVFALIVGDMFVMVPNAVGTILCSVQVVLYIMYRPGRAGAHRKTADAFDTKDDIQVDSSAHATISPSASPKILSTTSYTRPHRSSCFQSKRDESSQESSPVCVITRVAW